MQNLNTAHEYLCVFDKSILWGKTFVQHFALLLEHLMMHVSDPKFYDNGASKVCNFLPFQSPWEVPTDQFIKWADVYISNGYNLEIVMRFGFDNLIWYYIALTVMVLKYFIFVNTPFVWVHLLTTWIIPSLPSSHKCLPVHTSPLLHCTDVTMSTMVCQITSSASLAFVWVIHRCPVNSPHKGPVTSKSVSFSQQKYMT